MKRLISILLCLLLAAFWVPFCYAGDLLVLGSQTAAPVVDEADLLTDQEEAELARLSEEISERQKCDVAVVTVNGLGFDTAEAYADDYFDYNGYGYGDDRSGILFLLSIEDRDFAISTRGEAIQAFPDDALYYIFNNKLRDSLSYDDFFTAFKSFLTASDSMLNVYRGTASEAEMNEYGDFLGLIEHPKHYLGSILIALALGFLVAYVPMSALKAQVKNVRRKTNASNYMARDSMHMNVANDRYLYANTVTRVIQRETRPSGGGSSTHISSSGATHGGISGKF